MFQSEIEVRQFELLKTSNLRSITKFDSGFEHIKQTILHKQLNWLLFKVVCHKISGSNLGAPCPALTPIQRWQNECQTAHT